MEPPYGLLVHNINGYATSQLIKFFTKPPNNWSVATIKSNIIDLYSKSETSASRPADPKSIMAYK